MDMLTCEQEYTAAAPASSLGFHTEVAPPAPTLPATIPDEEAADAILQSVAPAERENLLADLIKQNSLYSTYLMQRQLSTEGLDPSTPRGQRINIMDQMAKLSGLTNKQVAKESGQQVSITINIPTLDDQPSKSITIEQTADEPSETVIYADSPDDDKVS